MSTKGVDFTEIDVGEDRDRREEMVARASGRRTVPQIFIDGSHVGGYEELAALDRAGEARSLARGASPRPSSSRNRSRRRSRSGGG